MRLSGDQFEAYFQALHGYAPFPWQSRLACRVLETGRWPELLDIPTGLGKTSAIDIALFALAARPEVAPRRILLVVDRRVVVDQAADHARKIQSRVAAATGGVLASVAAALRQLWAGTDATPPFEVAVLRGGMPRDEAWVQRPDRPVVALSTVDQVGSRLLFRGYGVSSGMAPIHAGLLGQDALILLDEVQLSTAFAQTLRAIDKRWRPWRAVEQSPTMANSSTPEPAIPDRWQAVQMSATPLGDAVEEGARLCLDDDDLAHPIVQRRRNATKVATLGALIPTVKTDPDRTLRAIVSAFAKHAVQVIDSGARRTAVIVNRVATARAIHQQLKQQLGERADVVLLTGRMRPLDRLEILGDGSDPESVAGRVSAGAERGPQQRPVILVSTQAIEAGADFDFDALVTECASLDALRQRFGRLDRRGELGESRAVILVRKDQVSDSKDDPVYGEALSNTWVWLESQAKESGSIDFGIAHFPAPTSLTELCSPVVHAPVLLPAHLDAWAQTNPRGEPDPDVALWLHGPQRGTAEVRVVWRGDIRESELDAARDAEKVADVEQRVAASLAVAPPSSVESISLPIAAFRSWITQARDGELVDVEGAVREEETGRGGERNKGSVRPFFIATRSGVSLCRSTAKLYPEATVVVPASYGGIGDGNWNPEAKEPVGDLGDLAQLLHRAKPVLRLVPEVLCSQLTGSATADSVPTATSGVGAPQSSVGTASASPEPSRSAGSRNLQIAAPLARSVPVVPVPEDPDFEPRFAVRDWLKSSRDAGSDLWRLLASVLSTEKAKPRVIELGGGYLAVVGRRCAATRALFRGVDPTSDIVNDDDDSASYIGQEVSLAQHLGDVERWARAFASNVGLPEALSDDLALAARMHDIGKADPRFQQMLHGGSAVRMAASEQLLAKSRGQAADRAARSRARERAKYPSGYRHELLSVAMLSSQQPLLEQAKDPELVLHLVGSHHGWCRPFASALDHGPSLDVTLSFDGARFEADTAHGLARPDSGVADRFWQLTERYGWWTLAWFEALLRLADHRASEERASGGTPLELEETAGAPEHTKGES